jgi:HAMP domain-containing protein
MTEGPAKYKRRHYLIDRHFQLRYLLTYGIPMLFMLGCMLCTLYFATVTAVDSASRILRHNIESTVALSLQDNAAPSVDEYQSVLRNISTYVGTFSKNGAVRRELMPVLLGIFGVGFVLVTLELALLTVFFSHRIAGPVYRFERILREVAAGRYTSTVTLRRSDELQHLAVALNMAISATRTRLRDLADAVNGEQRKRTAAEIEI